MSKSTRPRNIGFGDLMHYRFPPMAIASILHRISGVILFLFVPFILCVLDKSLHSSQGFSAVMSYTQTPMCKFWVWLCLSALIYHFIAGLKHLLMDLGFFEEKLSGRVSSTLVIVISLVAIVALGVWLW